MQGPQIEIFEKKFAQFCGAKYCALVASGTDALYLVLKAIGIKPGDEVITPSFTFVATSVAIVRCGAKPVFVDIDQKSFNIDPEQIEQKISPKTKAILPVDLFGQMADMEKIRTITQKHKLKIIEDACQAHGASTNGKSPASLSDAAAFSFYPTKNLSSFSDSGAVVTNDQTIFQKVKKLANYGYIEKYIAGEIGTNSRSDEFQAVWLQESLKKLPRWNKKRQILAKRYKKLLSDLPIILPEFSPGANHVYHQFVIRTAKRNLLKKFLFKNHIATNIHYPKPIHLQPAFKFLGKPKLINSEKVAREILSLPIYPQLSIKQQNYICDNIKAFFNK